MRKHSQHWEPLSWKLHHQHLHSVIDRTPLEVQWLRLHLMGLIPGLRTKIPQASEHTKKKKKKSVVHKLRQRYLLSNPPGDGLPELCFSRPRGLLP